jgi:hypothetical protein
LDSQEALHVSQALLAPRSMTVRFVTEHVLLDCQTDRFRLLAVRARIRPGPRHVRSSCLIRRRYASPNYLQDEQDCRKPDHRKFGYCDGLAW